MSKQLYIAKPSGICTGVNRALKLTEKVLMENPNRKIFIFHEIVHNTRVVKDLSNRGAIFVEDLNALKATDIILFSAHGVSESIENEAKCKNLQIIDATCPLVKKLHNIAENHHGCLIIAGHRNHPEVEGILGRGKHLEKFVISSVNEAKELNLDNITSKMLLLSQTTFNSKSFVEISKILQKKYPSLEIGDGVCYATEERQNAIAKLAKKVEYILIAGSPTSSNSKRLCEVARENNCPAMLIDNLSDIPFELLKNINKLALGAGASAPDCVLEEIITALKQLDFIEE